MGIVIASARPESHPNLCNFLTASLKETRVESLSLTAIDQHFDHVTTGTEERPDLLIVALGNALPIPSDLTFRLTAHGAGRLFPLLFLVAPGSLFPDQFLEDEPVIDIVSDSIPLDDLLLRVRFALRLKREMDLGRQREEELHSLRQRLNEIELLLQRQSVEDLETGVASRSYFERFAEQELRRARRESTPLSLIMVRANLGQRDCDTGGNDMMRQLAGHLSANVGRGGDLVASYEEGRFAVLLPSTGIFGATAVAERMRSSLEEERAKGERWGSSASFGVASLIPEGDVSLHTLVSAALQALLLAESRGGNRVEQG
jgi:diguanylate cyclase (GGDEF)-like protein